MAIRTNRNPYTIHRLWSEKSTIMIRAMAKIEMIKTTSENEFRPSGRNNNLGRSPLIWVQPLSLMDFVKTNRIGTAKTYWVAKSAENRIRQLSQIVLAAMSFRK